MQSLVNPCRGARRKQRYAAIMWGRDRRIGLPLRALTRLVVAVAVTPAPALPSPSLPALPSPSLRSGHVHYDPLAGDAHQRSSQMRYAREQRACCTASAVVAAGGRGLGRVARRDPALRPPCSFTQMLTVHFHTRCHAEGAREGAVHLAAPWWLAERQVTGQLEGS